LCSITGLPLVAIGGIFLGVTGALGGVLVGLAAGIVFELYDYLYKIRPFIGGIPSAASTSIRPQAG
jgi:hypothetical protein